MKVEPLVRDDLAAQAVDLILAVARTGSIGDGKVFVSPADVAPSEGASPTADERPAAASRQCPHPRARPRTGRSPVRPE